MDKYKIAKPHFGVVSNQEGLSLKQNVMPFSERIERMCRMPNAYIGYKKNQVEILADKKAYEV